jgi:multisubunit Na+/H+ antiporter MnhB subunit
MVSRIAALLAALAIAPGLLHRLPAGDLLAPAVAARLAESGVDSAVTAVLLNFRALDTLLEVSVLAAAVIGALARPVRPPPPAVPVDSLLPAWLIPRLLPLIGLLVVHLWWAGSSRPGGAFQAGAALTGLLLLLHYTRTAAWQAARGGALALALGGPLLFLAVGLLPVAGGGTFLDYPPGWATALILVIEAGLTAAVGAALLLLALGGGERQ